MRFDLGKFWSSTVRMFQILVVSDISSIAVILLSLFLFEVDQVRDAIIALNDFGSFHHFVILVMIGLIFAFFVWYWAQVFYYIEYRTQTKFKEYEKAIIKHIPHALGTSALLIMGLAFLFQAPKCQIDNGINPLYVVGTIFLTTAVIFFVLVSFRRRIFNIKSIVNLYESIEQDEGMVLITDLPNITKKILIITTIISVVLLLLITISPIKTTGYMGDGVTVLITCFSIWVPLLYWIRYFSLKIKFPVFLILSILIISFSFFNSNKNIRTIDISSKTEMSVGAYCDEWLQKVKNLPSSTKANIKGDTRKPMFIVLSEGGGIRAAYWSAELLARIQRDFPLFREYLFCISSVSGGSFGATVFDGVLKYYDSHPEEMKIQLPNQKNIIQKKITDIVGKDFLSPALACMFTREMVQLLLPFPVQSFDRAKVFEDVWEDVWESNLNNDSTFNDSFLSLWNKKSVPPIFLNTTQVQNGYPVVLSNLKFVNGTNLLTDHGINSASDPHFPLDFYDDAIGKTNIDVPLSTGALLSARFPFISPAGIIEGKNTPFVSFVDGGYFDNTGANTAYKVLFDIERWYEKKSLEPVYLKDIKPVIIYIKNGMEMPDEKNADNTMLGQLLAPIQTSVQIRDANTENNFTKLVDFVKFYNGEVITCLLQKSDDPKTDMPLGWALSKKVQEEIDTRAEKIDISEISKYLSSN